MTCIYFSYDILHKDSGREIVEDGVIETTITLDLPIGRTYNIVAIATDNVGNTAPSQDVPPSDFYEIVYPEITCKFERNMEGLEEGFEQVT